MRGESGYHVCYPIPFVVRVPASWRLGQPAWVVLRYSQNAKRMESWILRGGLALVISPKVDEVSTVSTLEPFS